MKKDFCVEILENRLIAKDIYKMIVLADKEQIAPFKAGQFAHIKVPAMDESILRRPISINYVDRNTNEMSFCYAVVGKGTAKLAKLKKGDCINMIAPLGNGFPVEEGHKKIWLAGGGIGIAPLASVIKEFPGREYTAFLGYRDKSLVYGLDDFESCKEVIVTTDDGSFETKGYVTDIIKEKLKEEKPDVILACGPHMFFKALEKAVEGSGVKTYISMEQRMGCGTGGCATCVCKIAGDYKKVCADGPVFSIEEAEL